MRLAAILALAALALAGAAAQGTKGQNLRGYTFVSDVTPSLGVSKDVCAIKRALNSQSPDYDAAQRIYEQGTGSGMTLQSIATSKDAPPGGYWALSAKHYKDPSWLNTIMRSALAGVEPVTTDVLRVQMIAKTLGDALQVALVMRNLDTAIELARGNKLSPVTGAPHSVDQAWAVFVGGEPNCGLWAGTLKRAALFGTRQDCDTSNAAVKIQQAMIAAQQAAIKGDVPALVTARNAIQAQLAASYVQATIAYAHEMYLDQLPQQAGADIAPRASSEDQAQAYAFFRVIAPLVFRANDTAGQALNFWLYPGQPPATDVDLKTATALAAAYKGMSVAAADVGQYGKKQAELACNTGRRLAAASAGRQPAGRRLMGSGSGGSSGWGSGAALL